MWLPRVDTDYVDSTQHWILTAERHRRIAFVELAASWLWQKVNYCWLLWTGQIASLLPFDDCLVLPTTKTSLDCLLPPSHTYKNARQSCLWSRRSVVVERPSNQSCWVLGQSPCELVHVRADSTVIVNRINDNTVKVNRINDNTVIGNSINDNTVIENRINDNTVIGNRINDNTVIGNRINDNTVIVNRINDNTVIGNRINDNTVIGNRINDNTAIGNRINDNTVIENRINGLIRATS